MIATIVPKTHQIRIGKDFVDAETGNPLSHGWIELRPIAERRGRAVRYIWQSTAPVFETEHLLRIEAEKAGKRVTGFMSQAIAPLTIKTCPKCKSTDVDRCHHNGTFALPECDFYRCNDCFEQWDHT